MAKCDVLDLIWNARVEGLDEYELAFVRSTLHMVNLDATAHKAVFANVLRDLPARLDAVRLEIEKRDKSRVRDRLRDLRQRRIRIIEGNTELCAVEAEILACERQLKEPGVSADVEVLEPAR